MSSETQPTQDKDDVLVVDDRFDNLRLLHHELSSERIRVRPIADPARAVACALAHPPDLFVLDVKMPNIDGFALCDQIKNQPALADVPVIFLSAVVEPAEIVRSFRHGGIDFLTKPLDTDELRVRVANHLERRRSRFDLKISILQLSNQQADLEKIQEFTSLLTKMMLHEIRTPLTAVMNYLDLLEMEDLPGNAINEVKLATRSAKRLQSMVDAVYQITRLDRKQPFQRQPCDLNDIFESLLREFVPPARLGNLSLQKSVLPPVCNADHKLLRMVIENLLNRAMHSKLAAGAIRVAVTLEVEHVGFVIDDDAVPISDQFCDDICNDTGFSDTGLEHPDPAIGLELMFCKLVVEALGGSIACAPSPIGGSRFIVKLPRFYH